MVKRFARFFGCWLILSGFPTTAQSGEAYYVVVFSHQGRPNLPRSTHTFATFIKATGEGSWPEQYAIDSHTISWSPGTLAVRALRFHPEQGVNLDLDASLHWALSVHARLSRWGPFQIQKELYDRALRQIALLQSGAVQYKTIDTGYRPARALNCIHAVSDIDADEGLLDTGIARGEAASALVAAHFRRWMIEPGQVHEWVYHRLGLSRYPITLQHLEACSGTCGPALPGPSFTPSGTCWGVNSPDP